MCARTGKTKDIDMQNISYETTRYQRLKAQLLATHADVDEETLADTLEGLSDLPEIVATTLRSALEDEAHSEAIASRLSDLKARRERLVMRAKTKRCLCASALAEAGLKKVLAPDLTISLRSPQPRLVIEDQQLLPAAFWDQPEPVVCRRELSAALKSGASVPGAHLVDGEPSVSVRVK